MAPAFPLLKSDQRDIPMSLVRGGDAAVGLWTLTITTRRSLIKCQIKLVEKHKIGSQHTCVISCGRKKISGQVFSGSMLQVLARSVCPKAT